MSIEMDTKRALREWVVRSSGKVRPEDLDDQTPILERRIITSLQVMDLLLFLERLTGRPIDLDGLRPGAFRNIDVIYRNFCGGNGDAS